MRLKGFGQADGGQSRLSPSGHASCLLPVSLFTMADAILSSAADFPKKLATLFWAGSSPPASSKLDLSEQIREETERLSRLLERIRARLRDAEELEVTDASFRHWLQELEGVAFDVEDLLDELLYESTSSEGTGHPPAGKTEEATKLVALAMGDTVLQRIVKIKSRFEEISEHRVALQLKESDGQRRVETPARQQSTSLMEENSCIVGREEDLKMINKFLLSDAELPTGQKISMMAIVGMGGLGKTTLAQLAYHDSQVIEHFELRLWVCVSEDFDLVRLTRAMLECVMRDAPIDFSELNTLQEVLKEKLRGKRFLLVFDDVWEHDIIHWDDLRKPLLCGTNGSKILITTRNEKVARITGAVSTHCLPFLPEEDCLQLFNQGAFEARDPALHPELRGIGREIAKKCRGIPLVAKILGAQLRWVDDEQKWKDILGGDIWDIDRKGIMPVLKLSYDLLPAHLRKCFRYCSLFPKNYQFDKDKLVRMWMAHDYVEPKGRRPVEDIGLDYFDELLWRSFFQCSPLAKIFRMHDLIHELARHVSREECYSLEDSKPCGKLERHVRHFSIISSKGLDDTIKLYVQLLGNLRSFVFMCNLYGRTNKMEPLNNVFSVAKYLRVLDLSGSRVGYLPNSIGDLKLLRYLGLPDHLGGIALGSNLRLPDSISKLHELRHLIYAHDVIFPVGIGNLSNLETMPGFDSRRNYGAANLGELKDMNNIRCLRISGLDSSTNVEVAKKACLEEKHHLRELHLNWIQQSPFDDQVLETLKPGTSLESLKIDQFKGQSFPSWLGHGSFSKLASVKLTQCYQATLPSLGHLPSLKYLSIQSSFVEYIGDKFFLGGFPQLETLLLTYMSELRSTCDVQNCDCPCLKELIIRYCPLLASVSLISQLPRKLQKLEIYKCPLLTDWCERHQRRLLHIPMLNVQGMDNHRVVLKNVARVQEAAESSLRAVERLRTLELEWDGDENVAEPENVLENLRPLGNLATLVIKGYAGLSFATWLGDPSFSNLICVTLSQCSQCKLLPPLGRLPHLMQLYINGAQRLERVGNEFFGGRRPCVFPSLKSLEFDDLPIWEEWQGAEDGDLPSLNKLTIRHCPRLREFPPLTQLKELELEATENLMLLTSLLNLSSLQTLRISELPHLRQLPALPLHLVELAVKNLPVVADLRIPSSVRNLTLEGCNVGAVVATLPCLTNLTSLRISHLRELEEPLQLHNLVALQELHVSSCPRLKSLDCFYFSPLSGATDGLQALESLRHLSVTDCPELHFYANERPPSTLRYLALTHCHPSLVEWCDRDLSRLAHIREIWVDQIQVSTKEGSIRSQIEEKKTRDFSG